MLGSGNLHEEAAIPSGRQIEEDAFIAHLLQLFVGYFVAMLDRVYAGFDGGFGMLAVFFNGMGGNLKVLTMSVSTIAVSSGGEMPSPTVTLISRRYRRRSVSTACRARQGCLS